MSFSLERILQVLAAVQGIQHPHSSVDPLAASEQGDRPDEALLYQVNIIGFLTEFYWTFGRLWRVRKRCCWS